MIYCEKLFKNIFSEDYDVFKDRIFNIYHDLYTFVEVFSTSLELDEYHSQRFNGIFIFTKELLIFEKDSTKDVDVFIVYGKIYAKYYYLCNNRKKSI